MDTVALVGRLLVSLAFVLGLMWVLARRVKRPARGKGGRLIDVLARQQLSRTASVAVVRVMDQALILGITDGQVSVIGESELEAVEARLEDVKPARTARPARAARPNRAAPITDDAAPVADGVTLRKDGAVPRKPLAGSALSPDTWRQTLDALRDLTVRTR